MQMIHIAPSVAHEARALFSSLEHHALIYALFENNLEAQLFIDDATQPKAGMIAYRNNFFSPQRKGLSGNIHIRNMDTHPERDLPKI